MNTTHEYDAVVAGDISRLKYGTILNHVFIGRPEFFLPIYSNTNLFQHGRNHDKTATTSFLKESEYSNLVIFCQPKAILLNSVRLILGPCF